MRKADNLPPSCADVTKSAKAANLQPQCFVFYKFRIKHQHNLFSVLFKIITEFSVSADLISFHMKV